MRRVKRSRGRVRCREMPCLVVCVCLCAGAGGGAADFSRRSVRGCGRVLGLWRCAWWTTVIDMLYRAAVRRSTRRNWHPPVSVSDLRAELRKRVADLQNQVTTVVATCCDPVAVAAHTVPLRRRRCWACSRSWTSSWIACSDASSPPITCILYTYY